jgi:endonuclease YncB( thermonuclease family)
LVALTLVPDAAAAKAKIGCAVDPAARGEVRAIDDRLDLTLTDGTVLKLAGVEPPAPTPDDPALDQKARARLEAWLVGREIRFVALDNRKDRWGRMPALVLAEAGTPGAPLLSVGAAVLGAGLGRFAPVAAARPCRAAFLAAEATARRAEQGIWADPYYAVIAASDRAGLYARTGSSVIVEGETIGVAAGQYRTTLWFGTQHGRDFSVTISRRNVALFRAAELDPDALNAKRLRVRGLLDTRFGPQIDIATPDAIEIVGDSGAISPEP